VRGATGGGGLSCLRLGADGRGTEGAIALLFNVLMLVVAIITIALTVPRDDPSVGR
jgi:hypothetical protein